MDRPYQHPLITDLVHKLAFKNMLFDCTEYTSSEPTRPDAREVPTVMVALSATAVSPPLPSRLLSLLTEQQGHAALTEWQSGHQRDIQFSEEHFAVAYRKYIKSLDNIDQDEQSGQAP